VIRQKRSDEGSTFAKKKVKGRKKSLHHMTSHEKGNRPAQMATGCLGNVKKVVDASGPGRDSLHGKRQQTTPGTCVLDPGLMIMREGDEKGQTPTEDQK